MLTPHSRLVPPRLDDRIAGERRRSRARSSSAPSRGRQPATVDGTDRTYSPCGRVRSSGRCWSAIQSFGRCDQSEELCVILRALELEHRDRVVELRGHEARAAGDRTPVRAPAPDRWPLNRRSCCGLPRLLDRSQGLPSKSACLRGAHGARSASGPHPSDNRRGNAPVQGVGRLSARFRSVGHQAGGCPGQEVANGAAHCLLGPTKHESARRTFLASSVAIAWISNAAAAPAPAVTSVAPGARLQRTAPVPEAQMRSFQPQPALNQSYGKFDEKNNLNTEILRSLASADLREVIGGAAQTERRSACLTDCRANVCVCIL
jgi:hypothetical protein